MSCALAKSISSKGVLPTWARTWFTAGWMAPLSRMLRRSTSSFGLAGVGITYGAEPVLRPHIDAGRLKPALREWASPGEGFYAYYSSRRQVPTALRLLIDLIREIRPLGI